MRHLTVPLTLGTALVLALSACSNQAEPVAATDTPVAVATTTMLGSVLGDITSCAGSTSMSVMKPGDDPHTFSLSSDQVAMMVRSKLVIANGLGLEEGISSALENVTRDGGKVFEVAPTVAPIGFGGSDGHGQGKDPHFWLDASRMAQAASNVGSELASATGDAKYEECGRQVADELKTLHEQVKQTLSAVPQERRVLVTDHDAFGYFAKAYGFSIVGVVVPGGSTDAEPSSADLAKITDAISSQGVTAIFSNTAANDALVQAVAGEVGQEVQIVPLYVGSLGPQGSGADTYAGMMITNATLIAEALK